jgi:hypothetical protein
VTTLSEPYWSNKKGEICQGSSNTGVVYSLESTTVVGDYLSILAHNKRGEFLVYEGFAGPGRIYDLRIKDFSESIDSENESI